MSATLLSDLRLACRMMRRQPMFAVIVVATLALGIGANTAMFAIVHAALLQAPPYKDPERLVMARRTTAGAVQTLNSTPDYYDYKEQATSFESLVAAHGISLRSAILSPAEHVMTTRVSSDFFPVMGVQPVAGRAFVAGDGDANAPCVALIGQRLAERRFGTAHAAIGRTVDLSGVGRTDISPTVVGVLPSRYLFLGDADVWLPMRRGENDAPQTRNQHRWVLVGRLKRGVTLEAAQSEVDAVAKRLEQLYPASNRNKRLRLDPLQTVLSEPRRPRLMILTGVVGLILLIACANVAGLLLARGAGRRSELALRAALGATRVRIAGQLLVESTLLGTLAGSLGIGLAIWLQRLLAVAAGFEAREVVVNATTLPVLLFTLLLSVATGVLFGVVPAAAASATCPAADLVPTSRATPSRGTVRLRAALVGGQVALSLVLVIAAGLLIRSFMRLNAASLGFETSNVLTGSLDLPRTSLEQRLQFYRGLRDDLVALPGVKGVAFVSHLPIRDAFDDQPFWIAGRNPGDPAIQRAANMRLASSGYFRTMGIPVLAGRDFGDGDGPNGVRVLVINDRLARTAFGGGNPIGQHVTMTSHGGVVDFEIVGIVGDARIDSVALPPPATMYAPVGQFWDSNTGMSFVIRAGLKADVLSESVRRLVAARNPNVPSESLVTMEAIVGNALRLQRVMTLLLGLLSAVALVLAAVGLYGVLAYHVAQRMRELGVRVALGASPSALMTLVLSRSAAMVLPGVALGLVASRAACGVLARFLYEVPPTDAITYGAAAFCLVAVGLLASAWPAYRAGRVDPVEALRGE